MKKIFRAVFVVMLAMSAFSSCSDVPAPYEILEPNQGGEQGGVEASNPFGLDASNPVNDFSADFEEQPDFTPDGDYSSNLNYDYEKAGWKNLAEVGDRKWTGVVFKDGDKYLRASSNKGKKPSYTSWFISPAFNVDKIKDMTVSFDCAGAFFYQTTTLKVYFLELVDGNMKKTDLEVKGIPTSGGNYEWVKGINVDLKNFAGKVGFIGFEYVGEGGDKKSTTYTLDNIKCGKAEAQPEKPQPEKPQGTVVVTNDKPFSATFAKTEDGFIADNVTIDPALNYVWKHDANRGQFKASASKKNDAGQYVNYVTESLLKSPLLDLSKMTKVVLTFEHFTNHMKGADAKQYFSVQVQEEGQTTWETVAIPTYPAKDGYDFVASGDMDLSKYAGKKIVVAFKYTSDAKAAGTWGLKNVKVGNGEAGGQQGGGDQGGQTEQGKGVVFTESFGTPQKDGKYWPSVDKYTGWDNKTLKFSDPKMTGKYSNASVRTTSSLNGHIWFASKKESALKIEGFNVSASKGLKLTYDIAANAAGNQNVILVSTDKGDVVVADKAITEQNKYQTVELTLPEGITFIQFTSTAATNTVGYRIDNVKLVSTAK